MRRNKPPAALWMSSAYNGRNSSSKAISFQVGGQDCGSSSRKTIAHQGRQWKEEKPRVCSTFPCSSWVPRYFTAPLTAGFGEKRVAWLRRLDRCCCQPQLFKDYELACMCHPHPSVFKEWHWGPYSFRVNQICKFKHVFMQTWTSSLFLMKATNLM